MKSMKTQTSYVLLLTAIASIASAWAPVPEVVRYPAPIYRSTSSPKATPTPTPMVVLLPSAPAALPPSLPDIGTVQQPYEALAEAMENDAARLLMVINFSPGMSASDKHDIVTRADTYHAAADQIRAYARVYGHG